MNNLDKFKNTFKEEATELLNSLEEFLLKLEDNPESESDIAAVFRAMHTIKGSAAMFGFQHISHFTHEVENLMDKVRNKEIAADKRFISLTLLARDHILSLLDSEGQTTEEQEATSNRILEDVKGLLVNRAAALVEVVNPDALLQVAALTEHNDVAPANCTLKTYRIRFKPALNIMHNGTRPLSLLKELSDMGECTITAHFDHLPELKSLNPENCYFFWDIMLTTNRCENSLRDVFIFVEDKAKLEISVADLPQENEQLQPKIGQILVQRGAVDPVAMDVIVRKQPRIGSLLVEAGVPEQEVKAALEEQQHIRQTRQKMQTDSGGNSIRVASEKLDILVDLVGEMVTLQARISQTARDVHDASLQHLSESLERLTSELRDNTMSIRMLPIGTSFVRFKRLVRDLSSELGKHAELETIGGDTELDKTVLEKLQDPLVHLIRNAVDHGIELPAVRAHEGKNSSATVTLSAEHAGSMVIIRVKDDGKGLDEQAILKKAIEKGIVVQGQHLKRHEIFDLVFLPGFSTAKQLTAVSGRGVGLDVVRKEIENLNGAIYLDSEPGKGTTFSLEIPLTLAIIEGLLIKVANENFIIPLSLVEECLEYAGHMGDHESTTIQKDGELLPVLSLRNVLKLEGEEYSGIQQIVVVGFQDKKMGMLVDWVVGDHQTVIKNLGRLYRDSIGMSGATILGDGSVALILDVMGLVDYYETRAANRDFIRK